MAEEKIIIVNLKKKLLKTPKWRRSKEAMNILKEILKKQRSEKIKIDKRINEKIWSKGIENPPAKLRLKIVRLDDKSIRVELL
jgi:large subunit ribosomal protein L31e